MAIGFVPVEQSNPVKVGDSGFINETGEHVKVISVKEQNGLRIATWVTVPAPKA